MKKIRLTLMATFCLLPCAFSAPTADAPAATGATKPFSADLVTQTGESTNRVDIMFIGDGWVESESAAMKTELDEHIASFFKIEVYKRYAKFFNVYRANLHRPPSKRFQKKTAYKFYAGASRLAVPAVDVRYVVNRRNHSGEGGHVGLGHENIGMSSSPDEDVIGVHELGHGWHKLADIYNGGYADTSWYNAAAGAGSKKWERWFGYVEPYNGDKVGVYPIKKNKQFRPIDTTITLMGDARSGSGRTIVYTPVCREKVVLDIYDLVDPIDSWTPNEKPLKNPDKLTVSVVDTAVIKVDWYVNDILVKKDGGATFIVAPHLTEKGEYRVRAHAYDSVLPLAFSDRGGDPKGTPGKHPPNPLDWVRAGLDKIQQHVSWTITVQ
jgi:hypothetical protein